MLHYSTNTYLCDLYDAAYKQFTSRLLSSYQLSPVRSTINNSRERHTCVGLSDVRASGRGRPVVTHSTAAAGAAPARERSERLHDKAFTSIGHVGRPDEKVPLTSSTANPFRPASLRDIAWIME
ncbi:hypothetical protein EVAR_23763_1 [Eumeta japonica]|uniref:Uncharacterized protein n=1 Tax=Eumeta variegata TaxID=151549 RepID=A0A4C1VIJ2_EUMVA|nr:hypothetical protein EVAR_23763_1 [Eumeta japonica]